MSYLKDNNFDKKYDAQRVLRKIETLLEASEQRLENPFVIHVGHKVMYLLYISNALVTMYHCEETGLTISTLDGVPVVEDTNLKPTQIAFIYNV